MIVQVATKLTRLEWLLAALTEQGGPLLEARGAEEFAVGVREGPLEEIFVALGADEACLVPMLALVRQVLTQRHLSAMLAFI